MIHTEVSQRISRSLSIRKRAPSKQPQLSLRGLKHEDLASINVSKGVMYARSESGLASYLPIPPGWPGRFGMAFKGQVAALHMKKEWGKILPEGDNFHPWAFRGKRFKNYAYHEDIPVPVTLPHEAFPWEDRERIERIKASMDGWGRSVRKDHKKLGAIGFPAGLIPTGAQVSRAIANEQKLEGNATFSNEIDFDSIGHDSGEPRSAAKQVVTWDRICSKSENVKSLAEAGLLRVKSGIRVRLIARIGKPTQRLRCWKDEGTVISSENPNQSRK